MLVYPSTKRRVHIGVEYMKGKEQFRSNLSKSACMMSGWMVVTMMMRDELLKRTRALVRSPCVIQGGGHGLWRVGLERGLNEIVMAADTLNETLGYGTMILILWLYTRTHVTTQEVTRTKWCKSTDSHFTRTRLPLGKYRSMCRYCGFDSRLISVSVSSPNPCSSPIRNDTHLDRVQSHPLIIPI